MIFALLRRMGRAPAFDAGGLGTQVLARPIAAGCQLPPACSGVVVDAGGHTRRIGPGGKVVAAGGEAAWCFHPGPYECALLPFAAAPEIGLHLTFAVDSPDPRVAQQRFDLYLASEASGEIAVSAFAAQLEAALQRELAQGNLELPPCTTLDEWNAFRAGLNQLLYTRFGVSIDDCVPVDLGGSRDYASVLRARAGAGPAQAAVASPGHVPAAFDAAAEDARALRRLFLELPCLMCGLRQAALPQGQGLFRQQQALLARLDLLSLAAGAMPALALAAPGQPLPAGEQARRARHSRRAAAALDEAWALLARFELAPDEALAGLLDEADRIVSNLEHETDERKRAAPRGDEE